MVGQHANVLPEEAGEEAQRQEHRAMMVSCFINTFSRLETVEMWVSMAPVKRSQALPVGSGARVNADEFMAL